MTVTGVDHPRPIVAVRTLTVAPHVMRGLALFFGIGRRKAWPRVKHGATEVFGHRVAGDGAGEVGAFAAPKRLSKLLIIRIE